MRRFVMALFWMSSAALAGEHGHHAHHAHVHGVATLEVVVEGRQLHLRLESPLDNVLGFEHAPANAGERAKAKAAMATVRAGERLFTPTPAAACRLSEAHVDAPVLQGQGKADAHGDLDAGYRFECARPEQLKGVAVRLFEAFPGMARIDAAVVTDKGQRAHQLNPRLRFLAW